MRPAHQCGRLRLPLPLERVGKERKQPKSVAFIHAIDIGLRSSQR
jgi:hypothetical protein